MPQYRVRLHTTASYVSVVSARDEDDAYDVAVNRADKAHAHELDFAEWEVSDTPDVSGVTLVTD